MVYGTKYSLKGKTMKKKILLISCLAVLACTVSGCSTGISGNYQNKLGLKMEKQSGISEDDDYAAYRSNLAAGNIVNGFYSISSSDGPEREFIIPADKAAVSFSSSSMFDIKYFSDEKHEFEIPVQSGEPVFFGSGDKIYASVTPHAAASENGYVFSEFSIFSYSGSEKKPLSSGFDPETGLVFEIPENCGGLVYSVEPSGKFQKRALSLSAFCLDDTFRKVSADGIWKINGTECSPDTAETDASSSYTVSFGYNTDEYFFVTSEPKCSSFSEGNITFGRVSPSDDITEYSVELHPFISTVLKTNCNCRAEINGTDAGSFSKGQDINLSGLRFGDTVVITCSKKEELQYDKNVLMLLKAEEHFGKYTFTVKEPSEDFTFNPADYRFEHGTVEFRYLGKPVTGQISLAAGRQLEYSALSADEGYWLPENDNTITVSENADETKKAIEQIRFFERKLVTVTLPQPAGGGTVTYRKGERTLMNPSEKLLSGTEIKMKFTPWNGWQASAEEAVYVVSEESDTQNVTVNGADMNSIFSEINEHRPHLRITADKQVGSNITFSVKTSDISESGLSWDKKKNSLVDKDTGTAEGITISADSGTLADGQVLKFTVNKTDKNFNTVKEIFYFDKISSDKKIDIYTGSEMKSSDVQYTDINIRITAVEKIVYTPAVFENAMVSLKFADTESRDVLSSGDIADKDRTVTVTLRPAGRYYISAIGITDGIYQEKMKLSQYLTDTERIDKSYPRKKICTLDLNTTDDYGKVSYSLNGSPVSGKTDVREDDDLVITYTLENRDYIIYKDFLSAMHDLLNKSPYERSEKISVTPALDGTVIRREDYITVQKKEK